MVASREGRVSVISPPDITPPGEIIPPDISPLDMSPPGGGG